MISIDQKFLSACGMGHLQSAQHCVLEGAEVLAKDQKQENSLMKACINGNLEVVNWLIEQGLSIHEHASDGWTAIHFAAYAGQASVVSRLIELGAKCDVKDKEGRTPLFAASVKNQIRAAKALLIHGCDVNDLFVVNRAHTTRLLSDPDLRDTVTQRQNELLPQNLAIWKSMRLQLLLN
jgi:ankyrin repeat protein